MLAVFMYHRIGMGKHANSHDHFRDHLLFLKEHFPLVLPGDPVERFSVCLTFDDATFDFYKYVFPLLKEHNVKVLLGVPVRYICEDTALSDEERLSVPYTLAMQDGIFDTKVPFCTWKELREMVQSGLVEVASHSFYHKNLTFHFVNLDEEILHSKRVLEEKLEQPISSFIYPFGRWNYAVQEQVAKHYPYAFRIGSAYNFSWKQKKTPLARISADNLKCASELFSIPNRIKHFFKAIL